jgi:hypothetical protein
MAAECAGKVHKAQEVDLPVFGEVSKEIGKIVDP